MAKQIRYHCDRCDSRVSNEKLLNNIVIHRANTKSVRIEPCTICKMDFNKIVDGFSGREGNVWA